MALDSALTAYPVPRPTPRPDPAATSVAPAAPAAPAAPSFDMNSAGANFAKASEQQKVSTDALAAAEQRAGGAKAALQETQADYIGGLHKREEQELRGLDQGEFKPTHDTLAGMGALFTMVGMMGAFMGGKGTAGAAASAQAALTGIISGWNKGQEADIAQQKQIFDTNAQYLKDKAAKVREIYKEYEEDALKVGIPTAQGRLQQRLLTEAEADVNAATVAQKGAAAGAKQAEDIFNMADAFDTKKMTLDAQRQNHLDSMRERAATEAAKNVSMNPEALDYYATRSIFTGKDPTFGMSSATARTSYQNYVALKAKALGITPQQSAAFAAGIGSNKVALNAITKVTNTIDAQEKSMLDDIKVAAKLQPDAQKSSLPFLNKWLQTGSVELGMKGAPPYAAAIITVADKFAKIISGSTGAAGSTDAARKQAFDTISPYLNDGQIGAVYDVLKADADYQKRDYEQVRQEILADIASTGAPAPDAGGSTPRKKVGDTIYQDGKPFKVTKVDENGRVLEAQ